jgi:spermidine synthase
VDHPVVVERVTTPRGELVLRRCGAHFELISNGVFLMDTRGGRSERVLVRAGLEDRPHPARLLIGGLGVGFTLVAALNDSRVRAVSVVEVEPSLIRWHETYLAKFTGGALDDPRVVVVVDDLPAYLRRTSKVFDVICLDIDNGPDWTVTADNAWLYTAEGTRILAHRLAPSGGLAVWSATSSPAYQRLLQCHFCDVRALDVAAAHGGPDIVFIARKPS